MKLSKRNFLKTAGIAGLIGSGTTLAASMMTAGVSAQGLSPITGDAGPITDDERRARIAKLQGLMQNAGIDALVLEPGSSMVYFTGIRWRRSERLTAAIIPATGEIGVVTPHFEEPSVRESLTIGGNVRVWNEHDNPFERVAGFLKDWGVSSGTVAIEETVRYFAVDGFGKALPAATLVSGREVTLGCRMYKTDHELALMQTANDVTMAAYRHVIPKIETGMTPGDVSGMMNDATRALGAQPLFALVLLNEASAYPHGTGQPQTVKEGGIVLMDCGCEVQGYESDISRTLVNGASSARQREVWETVRRGQQMVFEAATIGTPAGHVDDVVRRYYESLGYGPGYKTPGLSHRTGHGIGMDGHESVNLVHGEKTELRPGMCFSNEPGLYIFGEFGVRLEDCFYMTEAGPKWFSKPPDSLDDPAG